jgi:hypothetical protein
MYHHARCTLKTFNFAPHGSLFAPYLSRSLTSLEEVCIYNNKWNQVGRLKILLKLLLFFIFCRMCFGDSKPFWRRSEISIGCKVMLLRYYNLEVISWISRWLQRGGRRYPLKEGVNIYAYRRQGHPRTKKLFNFVSVVHGYQFTSINYRCEDGRFLLYAHCVTILSGRSVSSSETEAWTAINLKSTRTYIRWTAGIAMNGL